MKLFWALLLGLFSGFLIYMGTAMVFVGVDGEISGIFVAVTFVGGWALSTIWLRRNARSSAHVVKRGALLGTAEWLLMILVGLIFSGSAVASTGAVTDAELAGAAVGGGIIAAVTGVFSIAMAAVCLMVFGVAHLMEKESEKGNLRRCSECAEEVRMEARKCKHCGSSLDPLPAGATTAQSA